MSKNPPHDDKSEKKIREILKPRRDAFGTAARKWTPEQGSLEAYLNKQVEAHFPFEQFSIVEHDLVEPEETRAKFWWVRMKLTGNMEILRQCHEKTQWLEIDSKGQSVRLKEHIHDLRGPAFAAAVEKSIDLVREYLDQYNKVVADIHSKEVTRVKNDVEAEVEAPAIRRAAIEGTNLKVAGKTGRKPVYET